MTWRMKEAVRRKRGQAVIGARLVFDNGLAEDDPNYHSEEKIWGRSKNQTAAEFKAMIIIERDAWIAHFDRLDSDSDIIEEEL